jgi:hypothetical protein
MSHETKIAKILNQYPHLTREEAEQYLSRTKADHILNQYPHLSAEQAERISGDLQNAFEKKPWRKPEVAPITDPSPEQVEAIKKAAAKKKAAGKKAADGNT